MTVSTTARKTTLDGNDSTTAFPFTFKVLDSDDVDVILTSSAGTESTLTVTTDYSIALNADQDTSPGGTVTYPVSGDPLATGEKLTIVREMGLLQDTDLQNQADFYAETHEDVFDKLVMLIQDIKEQVDRSVKVDISSSTNPDDLLDDIDTAVAAAQSAQTGAEAAESNAESHEQGAETAAKAFSFPWVFDDSITMADPGAGKFRIDNATISSAAAIALSKDTSDSADVSDYVATWDDATNTIKGHLILIKKGAPDTFAIFALSAVVDNTSWLQATLTYVTGNNALTAADVCYIQFVRAGNAGADGADGIFSEIASQAEAEAGTDNTKGMTPLRVFQSISSLAVGVPVGTVLYGAWTSDPADTFPAKGAEVDQITYSDLYAAIGDTYSYQRNVYINAKPWKLQYDKNTVQATDITSWSAGTALPGALGDSQAIVTNSRAYLMVGHDGGAATSTVYIAPINADGTLGSWSAGTALPGALSDSQAIVTNSRVYLIGGYNGSAYTSTVYTATFGGGSNDYLDMTLIDGAPASGKFYLPFAPDIIGRYGEDVLRPVIQVS